MWRFKFRIGQKDLICIGRRLAHDRRVLIDICQNKSEFTALSLSEQIPGASEFKVFFRYFESIVCLFENFKPSRLFVGVVVSQRKTQ